MSNVAEESALSLAGPVSQLARRASAVVQNLRDSARAARAGERCPAGSAPRPRPGAPAATPVRQVRGRILRRRSTWDLTASGRFRKTGPAHPKSESGTAWTL